MGKWLRNNNMSIWDKVKGMMGSRTVSYARDEKGEVHKETDEMRNKRKMKEQMRAKRKEEMRSSMSHKQRTRADVVDEMRNMKMIEPRYKMVNGRKIISSLD